LFSITPLRRSGAGFCFPSLAGARCRADGNGAGRTATFNLQPTEKLCRRITAQALRMLIVILETSLLSKTSRISPALFFFWLGKIFCQLNRMGMTT
jgi:hypothetical protein